MLNTNAWRANALATALLLIVFSIAAVVSLSGTLSLQLVAKQSLGALASLAGDVSGWAGEGGLGEGRDEDEETVTLNATDGGEDETLEPIELDSEPIPVTNDTIDDAANYTLDDDPGGSFKDDPDEVQIDDTTEPTSGSPADVHKRLPKNFAASFAPRLPHSKPPRQTSIALPSVDSATTAVRVRASRGRCFRMPPLDQVRILIAALPPEVFRGGGAESRKNEPDLRAMVAAMWKWTQDSSPIDRMSIIKLQRSVTHAGLISSLMRPSRKVSSAPAIAQSNGGELLKQAALVTPARLAALEALTHSTPLAYRFSTLSWRDLERVIVAGLMQSPYARVVDMRNVSAAELAAADVVLIPFPLSSLRASKARTELLRAVARDYVPTLWQSPKKHSFVIARIIRDMASLKSLAFTLRPLVKTQPWKSAHYWSFEPYWNGILPGGQMTLPYPGSVQRQRRDDRRVTGGVPGWAPADQLYGVDPAAADSSSCDPLLRGSNPAATAAAAVTCSKDSSMEAVRRSRPVLVSFMGAPRGSMPERVSSLREFHSCADCASFDVRHALFRDGFGMPWVYSHSVFCIQPHGDSPSRKAFFDALLYGCIPVVLDKRDPAGGGRAPVLPFAHMIPYRQFVVMLTKREWHSGVARILRKVSAERIRAMQISLARHAHLLAYPVPPSRLDVDALLAPWGSPRRASSAAAESEAPQQQRSSSKSSNAVPPWGSSMSSTGGPRALRLVPPGNGSAAVHMHTAPRELRGGRRGGASPQQGASRPSSSSSEEGQGSIPCAQDAIDLIVLNLAK